MEDPQVTAGFELIQPSAEFLPHYVSALERGWSPDNLRPQVAAEQLARIAKDPTGFLAAENDPEGKGSAITLPDGSVVPRLPSYSRWMWDGEFCGSIGFRWQPGTAELPWYCMGHIGYTVVPWKRQRGYATAALRLLLVEVKKEGLPYVELTTTTTNIPSRRVIEANGGELVERFNKPAAYGGAPSFRFRIPLREDARGKS